jgi:hypothetical protein
MEAAIILFRILAYVLVLFLLIWVFKRFIIGTTKEEERIDAKLEELEQMDKIVDRKAELEKKKKAILKKMRMKEIQRSKEEGGN